MAANGYVPIPGSERQPMPGRDADGSVRTHRIDANYSGSAPSAAGAKA